MKGIGSVSRRGLVLGFVVFVIGISFCSFQRPLPQDRTESFWRREVLPLPHELAIEQVRRLKPDAIRIRGRSGVSGLEHISVSTVVALFKEKTGVTPDGKEFEILIGLMDDKGRLEGIEVPQGARLQGVPNCDQAYVIQPIGEKMLVVAALSEGGLYYGTRTLSQWLEAHLNKEVAEIPLAMVVDWPDLEERGFWHMPVSLIPWLASMKMNRFYVAHRFRVNSSGIRPTSNYNERNEEVRREWTPPYENARRYAAEVVPGPPHMDMWEYECKGYKEAFPDLPGKGESARNPFEQGYPQRVPCASNPDLVKILTIMMTNMAAQQASEVMVWMSEYPAAHCECEKSVKEGQYRGEVRAALEAWREARQEGYPHLKLSIFLGRGGVGSPPRYPDQEIKDIVASLPPEVTLRVSLGCDGPDGRLLADFASKGRRIARMDVSSLDGSSGVDLGDYAFSPSKIRHRMEQVAAGKYIGAWQFTPGGQTNTATFRIANDYLLSALAEYSWNSKGRNVKEFAEAWAFRHGCKDPEEFAVFISVIRNVPLAPRILNYYIRKWGMPSWVSTAMPCFSE